MNKTKISIFDEWEIFAFYSSYFCRRLKLDCDYPIILLQIEKRMKRHFPRGQRKSGTVKRIFSSRADRQQEFLGGNGTSGYKTQYQGQEATVMHCVCVCVCVCVLDIDKMSRLFFFLLKRIIKKKS